MLMVSECITVSVALSIQAAHAPCSMKTATAARYAISASGMVPHCSYEAVGSGCMTKYITAMSRCKRIFREDAPVRILERSHLAQTGIIWRIWLDHKTIEVKTDKGILTLKRNQVELL